MLKYLVVTSPQTGRLYHVQIPATRSINVEPFFCFEKKFSSIFSYFAWTRLEISTDAQLPISTLLSNSNPVLVQHNSLFSTDAGVRLPVLARLSFLVLNVPIVSKFTNNSENKIHYTCLFIFYILVHTF